MDNIYGSADELSWSELIKYTIIEMLGITFLIGLKKIGVISEIGIMVEDIVSVALVMILVQLINPKLSTYIIKEIKFRSESVKTVTIPILIAIATRVVIYVMQIAPTLWGGEAIAIAKGQVDMSTYRPIDRVLSGTIIGPGVEEFIFRAVFFTHILFFIGFLDSKMYTKLSCKVYDFRSIFCWMVIIINNILFALIHEPDITNFHLYFLTGVVNAIIYIKYGFYSSWISHGFFNYTSAFINWFF
jgi:membrane protease YdiL (CAAX protease family)|nr:MAG TPA: intermembrane metalloprotease [Caudoviricetes sp.]